MWDSWRAASRAMFQRWGGTGTSSNSQGARQTGDCEELANDKDGAREPKQDIDNSSYCNLCRAIPFCTLLKHPHDEAARGLPVLQVRRIAPEGTALRRPLRSRSAGYVVLPMSLPPSSRKLSLSHQFQPNPQEDS